MPIKELSIPLKKPLFEVSFVYLDKYDENESYPDYSMLRDLQSGRSGILEDEKGNSEKHPIAIAYWKN